MSDNKKEPTVKGMATLLVLSAILIFGPPLYNTFVNEPTVDQHINGHIEAASTAETPEQFISYVEQAKQGVQELGLDRNDTCEPWRWKAVKYRCTTGYWLDFLDNKLAIANEIIEWRDEYSESERDLDTLEGEKDNIGITYGKHMNKLRYMKDDRCNTCGADDNFYKLYMNNHHPLWMKAHLLLLPVFVWILTKTFPTWVNMLDVNYRRRTEEQETIMFLAGLVSIGVAAVALILTGYNLF